MDPVATAGLAARRNTQNKPEVRCFAASDFEPLVEFLAARILKAHQHHCPFSPETAATNDSLVCQQSSQPLDVNVLSRGADQAAHPWRILVGIGGIPGSGKSTLAVRLQAALNAVSRSLFCPCLRPTQTEIKLQSDHKEFTLEDTVAPTMAVALVGMDGFHLTRAELDKFPDPQQAHRRRGAPWTFDLGAFWERLHTLKTKAGPVVFPTFDHAVKVGRGIQRIKHLTGAINETRQLLLQALLD
ncbi:Predicted panthothenate kinase/uridine kinase-related protein, related [Eimeria praecox]|uniref:Predicted panthothenate kinase/uridine kinase-related protein, related n=1 Tax=Eimeria praecox TaxID=51316 RepID=U6H2G7_9EIME|nr:Predicted panthothenate kinase/uridine kinase-related protein, related [Eimeria praecox]